MSEPNWPDVADMTGFADVEEGTWRCSEACIGLHVAEQRKTLLPILDLEIASLEVGVLPGGKKSLGGLVLLSVGNQPLMTQASGLDLTSIGVGVANPYLPIVGDGAPLELIMIWMYGIYLFRGAGLQVAQWIRRIGGRWPIWVLHHPARWVASGSTCGRRGPDLGLDLSSCIAVAGPKVPMRCRIVKFGSRAEQICC